MQVRKTYPGHTFTSDMDIALRFDASGSPSVKWSLYAGLFMFICGTATVFFLADLLTLLADVIGLPGEYATIILASPALIFGSVTWWLLVERRKSYTYLLGGAFGLVTALLTGLLWTVQFVSVWGVEMLVIPIISVLVMVVLGFASTAGVLSGLALMYARRRLTTGLPSGEGHAV